MSDWPHVTHQEYVYSLICEQASWLTSRDPSWICIQLNLWAGIMVDLMWPLMNMHTVKSASGHYDWPLVSPDRWQLNLGYQLCMDQWYYCKIVQIFKIVYVVTVRDQPCVQNASLLDTAIRSCVFIPVLYEHLQGWKLAPASRPMAGQYKAGSIVVNLTLGR